MRYATDIQETLFTQEPDPIEDGIYPNLKDGDRVIVRPQTELLAEHGTVTNANRMTDFVEVDCDLSGKRWLLREKVYPII